MVASTLWFALGGGILILLGVIFLISGIILIKRSNKKIWKIIIGVLLILISIYFLIQGIVLLWLLQSISTMNVDVGTTNNINIPGMK